MLVCSEATAGPATPVNCGSLGNPHIKQCYVSLQSQWDTVSSYMRSNTSDMVPPELDIRKFRYVGLGGLATA